MIDKNNVIVIGHGRFEGAKRAGMNEVPCLRAEDLSEKEIKALRLADNKLNESPWDFNLLNLELAELDDFGMDDFGFEMDFSVEPDTETPQEDEYTENTDLEAKAKVGDIYQLGRHRLICGDCTDKAVIDELMDGDRASLCLTDPPYGINAVKNSKVEGGGPTKFKGRVHGKAKNAIVDSKEYLPIIGDGSTDTARDNYKIVHECSDNQIIFGGNYFTDFLPPSRCWVVWDKENSGSFADVELAWTSFDRVAKLYRFLWNGLCRKGDRKTEGKTRVHPTQKPVGMLSDILKDFSGENDIILDCFGGSGSTLIACEQTGRKCYMCELEPHYVDVIIDRWEKFTGAKATKAN